MVKKISSSPSKKKWQLVCISLTILFILVVFYGIAFKAQEAEELAEVNSQKIIYQINQEIKPESSEIELEKDNLPENVDTNLTETTSNNLEVLINDKKPIIAIVIAEVGITKSVEISTLPKTVTLGISSYTTKDFLSENFLKNYDLMLNIPLESVDSLNEDIGPHDLILENSDKNNLARLESIFNRFPNLKSVYTNEDESFSSSPKAAEFLLNNFKDRNLIYLSGLTSKNVPLYKMAKKLNYNILAADVVLDNVLSSDLIKTKLEELVESAKKNGSAIAIGHPYPLTIEILETWLQTLNETEFRILPISQFYAVKLKREEAANQS